MPKAKEVAEIRVNGRGFQRWKTVAVTRSIDEMSGVAVFTLAEPGDYGGGWPEVKIKVGDTCQVMLAGKKVVEGEVMVRQAGFDPESHGIQITVPSKTINLVNSSVTHKTFQFKNYTFEQIANTVLKPFGMKITMQDQGSGQPLPRVNAIVGETVFTFLERLARLQGLILRDDADGNLIATKPQGGAVGDLVQGRNIKSANVVMNGFPLHSRIDVLAQRPGDDNVFGDQSRDSSARAENPEVKGHKPLVIPGEHPMTPEEAKKRAGAERAAEILKSLECSVIVQGWHRDDGSLWLEHVAKDVTVWSPLLFPTDQMRLTIRSVTSSQSDQTGTITTLELCLPGAIPSIGSMEGAQGSGLGGILPQPQTLPSDVTT